MAELDQYIQLSPKEVNILIAKIYLIDPEESNINEWQPVVNKIMEIDPKFRNSAAFKYFEASKFWRVVENHQNLSPDSMKK